MSARQDTSARPTGTGADLALIERYLRMLEVERKLSPHTVSNYRRDLLVLAGLAQQAAMAQPLQTSDMPHLPQLTLPHVRRFAGQLHGRGLGGRSIARCLSAWRTFFEWMNLHGLCAINPVIDVHAPRTGKRLPKALPIEQAVALAASRGGDDGAAVRDAAIRELLYSSGLRLSELIGLDVGHVSEGGYRSAGWLDLDSSEVTVTGKGGKQRHVPVGAAALGALRDWIAVRGAWVKADSGPVGAVSDRHALFLTARGKRIGPRLVQTRLKAHARQLGIPANVHPHVLRHSFASHVLQSSGDLRAVQEMLGHASIASTQVYTSLDFQRLAAVYDSAHPRARKR